MSGNLRIRESLVWGTCLSWTVLSGCGDNVLPQGGLPSDGTSPVVVLTEDQTVDPGAWVKLDGSASYDPAGRELNFQWSQVGGPDMELEAWRTPIASFIAPPSETAEPLIFKLEVNNGAQANEGTTTVRVIHLDPPPGGPVEDPPLRANAGADLAVVSGQQVTLDGSASSGPGEQPLEYLWSQSAGVEVELLDADQVSARFAAPQVDQGLETLQFELQVTQDTESDTDTVVVVVVAANSDDDEDDEQNSPACSDGLDNDDDGLSDYPADPGCDNADDDNEQDDAIPACADGQDNDSDGLIDYPDDPGCDNADDDNERNDAIPACADGLDNDGDGLIDYPADPGCDNADDNNEQDDAIPACADGLDNDADGLIDYPADPGCDSADDDNEQNDALTACADGLDNDGDGLIDYPADPGCDNADDDNEKDDAPPACSDGLDNDGDGLIDYPADPGCDDADDDNERDDAPLACADGVDNDGDGLIDFPDDPGCNGINDDDEFDDIELPACSDGEDNDGDGLTDYPDDPGCDNADDDSEYNQDSGQRLFTRMWGGDPEEIQDRYPEWGIERVSGFGAWCFDADDDGYWDEQETERRMAHCLGKIPEDYTGFVELDWEGHVTEVLRTGPDHPQFDDIIGEIMRLLTYVQGQRPLAQWGYYGWPKKKSWDPGWEESFRAAPQIFEQSDVLFPEVYDFHDCSEDPDDQNYECRADHENNGAHVLFALEMAEGKPVLAFSWHRYHGWADPAYAFGVIPHDEYVNHLRYMLNLEYEGHRPLGVVTWGATRWYFEEAFVTDDNGNYVRTGWWNNVRRRFLEEMLPGETIEEYVLRLHPMIYDNAAEAVYGE